MKVEDESMRQCFSLDTQKNNLVLMNRGWEALKKYFASHTAAPGSKPGSAKIDFFSLDCLVCEQY